MRPAVCLALAALVGLGGNARADDAGDGADPAYQTVVTGSRNDEPLADAPIATEVIGRAELEASGADTVAEALDSHPGLQIERGLAGAVLSIQGLDPEHTLVLVDGQRVIGRVGGGLDLARLPIAAVERIEIVKGPASALYGSDAIGGVVNVITRRTREPFEAEATSSYGSFGAAALRARTGASVGAWRASVSGGWQHGDGWDLSPGDPSTTASAHDAYHAELELRLRPTSSSWRAGASLRWLERDQQGVDASTTGAVLDRRNLTETIDVGLTPEWKPSLDTRLRLSAHYGAFRDQYVSDQRGSDALDQYQDTREQLAEASVQLDWLAGAHLLALGVDGLHETLRSPRLMDGRGARARVAVFAQDEWTVARTPRVVLVPALRIDEDTRFGTHLSPRLALRWDPRPELVVRGSVGLGYRAPDFKELYLSFENPGAGYVVEGNPWLRPETSRSLTLGGEWRASARVWVTAGVFRHDLEDLILAELVDEGGAGAPSRFTYVNVAAGTSQGGEVGARLVPARGLRLDAAYTFTDARDDQSGAQLEGRPRQRATFTASWQPGRTGLELVGRGSVVGPRAFYPGGERVEAAPFALVDLRAAWHFAGRFTVFAGVDNLLDTGDARFNPIQPRALHAGASARY